MPIRVTKPTFALAGVVNLDSARERRRVEQYRGRVELVLEENRRALTRLFDSGLVFTRHGSRVGQELLRAQQNLLRANDLMAREARQEGAPGMDALLDELETLLDRTSAIARRNKGLFQAP